jgi:hypothetical protein
VISLLDDTGQEAATRIAYSSHRTHAAHRQVVGRSAFRGHQDERILVYSMIDFIMSLPALAGAAIVIFISTTLGLLAYLMSHRFMSRYEHDADRDPTGSLFRVLGMLVSLMISLAFAEVVVEMRSVENAIERESIAIVDLFNNLQRFDVEQAHDAQSTLIDYTQAIIDDDWPSLKIDRLGERSAALRRQLDETIWNLSPETPVQEILWSQLLSDLDLLSDYSVVRLDNALAQPPVYLYLMFFGFILTMACFGTYRPTPPTIFFVSLYAVFVGLVLYLILALSDPFRGGFQVEPNTFEHVVMFMRERSL